MMGEKNFQAVGLAIEGATAIAFIGNVASTLHAAAERDTGMLIQSSALALVFGGLTVMVDRHRRS